MSLTGELDKKNSPVTRWFAERVLNVKPISDEWNAAVKAATVICPASGDRPHGTVGTAFDYRARYWFHVTPLAGLTASLGMRALSLQGARPIVSERAAPDALLALKGPPPVESASAAALLDAFAASLDATLCRLRPVGRILQSEGEQLLCRYCYVLALFEELYRAGLRIRSPLYTLRTNGTIDDLLALVPQVWVDDLCALSEAFAPHYAELADGPVVLNPTFAGSREIGGADADLIVNGCIYDIKTTVGAKFARTRVLYQLLGYPLLDYDDRYGIDAVGVYLSRQAVRLRWPLVPLLRALFDRDDVNLRALRASFREAVLAARVDAFSEVAGRVTPRTAAARRKL